MCFLYDSESQVQLSSVLRGFLSEGWKLRAEERSTSKTAGTQPLLEDSSGVPDAYILLVAGLKFTLRAKPEWQDGTSFSVSLVIQVNIGQISCFLVV